MTSPDLQFIKDIAQIVNYLALSVTGPLALFGFLRAKKQERADREYRIYDELDNKFLEYQKLALQHDLELIEVPDYDPRLGSSKLRKKQELVANGIAFSLFQRAYLMFHGQSDQFKQRQWRGWEQSLMNLLRRYSVRDAWMVCRPHYDVKFQDYIDACLVATMRDMGAEPCEIYAFRKTGLLVREETWHLFNKDEQEAWERAKGDYGKKAA